MGGRRGIWEGSWFPDRGGDRVFGDEPEPGFGAESIGDLIGGLLLCLFRGGIGGRGDLIGGLPCGAFGIARVGGSSRK